MTTNEVRSESAVIISEGTRLHAELFVADDSAGPRPTVIMCHGWGGTANLLREDAMEFARAGFLTVTFDYRGWGRSAARLVTTLPPTRDLDGRLIAEVEEVRGVVDPIDQTADIHNVLHWIHGESRCDTDRIGLWGSSFGGGHVLHVAARDPRVRAIVSQVPSLDSRWVINNPDYRERTFAEGTRRTRGDTGYPRPYAKFGVVTGRPVWEKLIGYAPLEDIDRCDHCAKLFVIAEHEELFDNHDHGIAAFRRANGIKHLEVIRGSRHYGVYHEHRTTAQRLAIDWFVRHLTRKSHTQIAP